MNEIQVAPKASVLTTIATYVAHKKDCAKAICFQVYVYAESNATYCISVSRSAVIKITAEVRSTVAKVHELFLNAWATVLASSYLQTAISQVLSHVVFDKGSVAQIQEAEHALQHDVNCDYYKETARFLGLYTSQFLKSAFENGPSMPADIRPVWLRDLLWQKPDGSLAYTMKGQFLRVLITTNDTLFARYIELGILQGLGRFAARVKAIQSNKFAVLEMVTDVIKEVTPHLQACAANHVDPLSEDQERKALHESLQTALKLFLPNGAQDFVLPIRDSLVSYVAPFLYKLLENEVLPQLFSYGLDIAKTPYVRMLMLSQGFLLEKANIETEFHAQVPPNCIPYPEAKRQELEKTLESCFAAGFDYIIPESKSFLKRPSWFAAPAALAMTLELPNLHLQDFIRLALQKMMVALNKEGEWKEEQGITRFKEKALQFEHTQVAKDFNDEQMRLLLKQEREHMLELARTTGADPKRIYQLVQSTALGLNNSEYAPVPESPPSRMSSVMSAIGVTHVTGTIGKICQGIGKQMAVGLVKQASAVEFIRQINQGCVTKLVSPQHDKLLVIALECILKSFK